jgi:hypothetical protein
MPTMMMQFLKQLTTVATSPYAFVAYIILVIIWGVVLVKTRRLAAISRNLRLLPQADRKSMLEKDYGFHLKEGMSASDFLKAQRAAYAFYAFIAVVLTVLIIVVLAIVRAKTQSLDSRRIEFQSAANRIISSIDTDFAAIKGAMSPKDSDQESQVFESNVLLPDSYYDSIEFAHDDVPAFMASLYHGEDPIVAFNVYQDFLHEIRLVAADWIPHAKFMDERKAEEEEKEMMDYVSFVKGGRKIIVSLTSGKKTPKEWHVMVMFKKVSGSP